MMNMARGTSLTGCWLRLVSGQDIGQADRQRLAWHLIEVALDDPQSLMLTPFEIMRMQLGAIILREWEIACGIYNNHAKKLDDVYLGHVERLKGTVRNTMDRAIKRLEDEASR